jgi:tRNA A-37 threonylcarbamoyl transferase component Bud32
MNAGKDTQRALVRVGYDGLVYKTFRGPLARERFENECRVLRYLEHRHCAFVPRLISADPESFHMITTNCGQRVERLDETRRKELFDDLERFGVRHEDPTLRNITYRQSDGRFCLIDFEFALILDDPNQAAQRPPPPEPEPEGP